jgi:ketosteroid isomerase-like protein
MRGLASLVLVLLASQGVAAQSPSAASPDDDAVLAFVDAFMHAVSTGDSEALGALALEGTVTTVAGLTPDGGTRITRRPFKPGAPASTGVRRELRERYWDPTVLVRGSMAVVWAPYEFWRDGETTHCGIDVFDLVKQDGAWRLAHIMYTVEPGACPALRPTDPSRIRPKS